MVPKAASPDSLLEKQLRNKKEMNINLRVAISYCQHLGLEETFINYKMCGSQITIIISSYHSFIIKCSLWDGHFILSWKKGSIVI